MTKILSISKARKELTTLVDRADRLMEKFTITVNGDSKAILMSQQEYESIVETLDILSQPGALEQIKKAEKDIDEGNYVTLDELVKELK